MAEPTTRAELIDTIKRRLGHPMVDINVTEEQFDDRVDQALRYYYDYHFNGADITYYKHQITADDKTNGYITIPENIIGVVQIYPYSSLLSGGDIFNIQYQIALNDLYTLTSQSMVPYFSAFQHLGLIQELLVGQTPMQYNRHKDRVYLQVNWDKYVTGNYLLVEAYEIVDPETFPEVWRDRWLLDYTEALFKLQWGNNLKLFGNIPLVGGGMINGDAIYQEAERKVEMLQEEMINSYSIPVSDMVG